MRPGASLTGNQSGSIPEIAFCEEKQRLLQQFVDAVKEIGRLQQAQMESVMNGHPEFNRMEEMLHAASQRKDAAKYALLAHIETHHC